MVTFPPIYIINLKRNPERRLYMQRQMDTLGLDYEFVDVDDIDKYELESAAYRTRIAQSLDIDKSLIEGKYAAIIDHAKTKKDKSWKNANLGGLATALSHIRIYDLMLKNDTDWACILEDDATLLPTFLEVFRIAPKLEWDILLLSHCLGRLSIVLKKRIKHVRMFSKDLVFLGRQLKETPVTQKRKDYRIKRLVKECGFNSRIYSKQSESFADTIKEYDSKYAEIAKTIMPANRRILMLEHEQYKEYKTLYRYLRRYMLMRFGALPEKTSLNLITKNHCIAEPKYEPYSTAAYLVNQSTVMKWKHEALAPNILAIDQIPWELHKNMQAKLRIITPPCATPTYSSFKYSSRLG